MYTNHDVHFGFVIWILVIRSPKSSNKVTVVIESGIVDEYKAKNTSVKQAKIEKAAILGKFNLKKKIVTKSDGQ